MEGTGRNVAHPAGRVGELTPLVAQRTVAAPPTVVFDLLDDLGNHDWIGGRWLDVVGVDRHGAHARGAELLLRRPFLPDRRAVSTIEQRRRPSRLVGTVAVPGTATARLDWLLTPTVGGTRVELTVTPLALRRRDRLWLAAGGRRWLDGRLARMLDRLARRLQG